jgi:hypothetical protein
MKIDNNLLSITNCIFKERDKWQFVTDSQKEEFAFIVNRLFSKMYPVQSQCLNHKHQDKVSMMNMWFSFQERKPYPRWFWSKSPNWDKTNLPEKDFKLLMSKLNINKEEDLIFLLEKYPEYIKEELKWFKR